MTFKDILNHLENAATLIGTDTHKVLLILAHFGVEVVPALTAVTDIVEVASGNATLIPITNTISGTVQTTSKEILNSTSDLNS